MEFKMEARRLFLLCLWCGSLPALEGSLPKTNELEQTNLHQTFPEDDKRALQEETLARMGLDYEPDPTANGAGTSASRSFMMRLSNLVLNMSHDQKDHFFHELHQESIELDNMFAEPELKSLQHAIDNADTIFSFPNHVHDDHTSATPRHNGGRSYWFNISDAPVGDNVFDAELLLFRQPSHDRIASNYHYTVNAYKVLQSENKSTKLHKLCSIEVLPEQEGWLLLNVTSTALDWAEFPKFNLGLVVGVEVRGRENEVSPDEIGIIDNKGPKEQQPIMVEFFKGHAQPHLRRTRAVKRQAPASANPVSNCRRESMYVKFRDIGYADVRYPSGFQAFYCAGECHYPLVAYTSQTTHAALQLAVNRVNSSIPKPCCSPTSMSERGMVFIRRKNSGERGRTGRISKTLKNMVVESCGCI